MPLSMIRLQGLRAHGTQQKSTVFAYADDVTILVTSQEDVKTVRVLLQGGNWRNPEYCEI